MVRGDQHRNIYTDESRQSGDRYMAFGGLTLSRSATVLLVQELVSFRHATLMFGELKWTKVSRSRLSAYMMLADIFFRHIRVNSARFHCMTVDKHILDFRTYHNGDRDRGFSVLYYNLLLHAFGRRYGKHSVLHAYLDYNDSKTTPEELRSILNSGMELNYTPFVRPFRTLQRVNSKKYDLVQVADVILGAIGWHKNRRHEKDGSSKAKTALAAHIAALAGVRDLGAPTPYRMQTFTVWHWTPQKGSPVRLGAQRHR